MKCGVVLSISRFTKILSIKIVYSVETNIKMYEIILAHERYS